MHRLALDWLEQLTEQDTRYVMVIAHNFKGYDSYFIVPRSIARKQKFEQIRTGGKLLELTFRNGYIRFIDSLSFLTTPLASFTSMFDLDPDEFAKGYFPICGIHQNMRTTWEIYHPRTCTAPTPCLPREKRSLNGGTRNKWPMASSLTCREIYGFTVYRTSNFYVWDVWRSTRSSKD